MTHQRATTARFAVILLSLSALVSIVAAVMAATGGFDLAVAGVPIRLHVVPRPVIVAMALAIVGIGAASAGHAFGEIDRVLPSVRRFGLAIAVMFAGAIAVGTFRGGAHIAGGADSSGYISEARLWRNAHFIDLSKVRLPTPLASEVRLTHGAYPFTPVGYQPSSTPGMAVPGYPPGLPLHFAIAASIVGEHAQFVVVPLCAAGIVILSFFLGRQVGGTDTALIAAACGGASPILLYQATQPMSDVVAAFWWTLAIVLLLIPRWTTALGAGVAAAIAATVRPNLFAVAPILLGLSIWWRRADRASIIRGAAFVLPVAIVAAAFAAFQQSMYGHASTTGYGSLSSLFAWEHVWANLQRYPRWAYYTQSALILSALAAPCAIQRGWIDPPSDRGVAVRAAWSGLIFFCSLQAFYLLYLSFDDWVYFRFLLPALPWILVLQSVTFAALCRRVPTPMQGVAVLLVAVLAASWGVGRARGIGAFRLQDSEQRYLDVADFVRRLPPNAAFVSLQHSGSLAYNAGAAVLRWDWVEPSELDRAVKELEARGHPIFAVLDDWEEAQFRDRFAGTRTAAALRPVFAAGTPPGITARVYAISAPTTIAGDSRVNWRSPPAPRTPSRPATRGLAFAPAMPCSRRSNAAERSCAVRR